MSGSASVTERLVGSSKLKRPGKRVTGRRLRILAEGGSALEDNEADPIELRRFLTVRRAI